MYYTLWRLQITPDHTRSSQKHALGTYFVTGPRQTIFLHCLAKKSLYIWIRWLRSWGCVQSSKNYRALWAFSILPPCVHCATLSFSYISLKLIKGDWWRGQRSKKVESVKAKSSLLKNLNKKWKTDGVWTGSIRAPVTPPPPNTS